MFDQNQLYGKQLCHICNYCLDKYSGKSFVH